MSKKEKAKGTARAEKKPIEVPPIEEVECENFPKDELIVKVKSLRLFDEEPKLYAILISFMDQPIIAEVIRAINSRDITKETTLAQGSMTYDPSDYEKMSYFADNPLVVNIQPYQKSAPKIKNQTSMDQISRSSSYKLIKGSQDVNCCNVDILPIFLNDDVEKICIKKRMEPMHEPSILFRKSWDCLPLVTMEVSVVRDSELAEHHKVLKKANWMKFTLVGMYNMITPYDTEFVYTAASMTPVCCETNTEVVIFNRGYQKPRRFDSTSFFPKWESLRVESDDFTRSDVKFVCELQNFVNEENINVKHYITKTENTAIWGSFHRTLMLKDYEELIKQSIIRQLKWPIEVHMYAEKGGFSFMGFINLYNLVYPGETKVRIVVPIAWLDPASMLMECGCESLLTPNDKVPDSFIEALKSRMTESGISATGTNTEVNYQLAPTGGDEKTAFVIVEVELGRPLRKINIPKKIYRKQIYSMLKDMENEPLPKRECTGRGQLETDWKDTVLAFAAALRRVPYYGTTDICTFNRQLSETRTRVELITSSWLDAAYYINNNFIVQQFLHSEETYEELLMIAHACLMRTAVDTLFPTQLWNEKESVITAARHARQMQDMEHAKDVYFLILLLNDRVGKYWRELSTCLKDVDREWANVCLNKALELEPRHPIAMLSKASTLFEEDPVAAEPFFVALLGMYPFWNTLWVIAAAYYHERGFYHMADAVLHAIRKSQSEGLVGESGYPRTWGSELGDWWDPTAMLPGTSPFIDAADLLFRLRAIPLAEVCAARAVATRGETAAYYHLVALACRLRGDYEGALCHLQIGCKKFGEVTYLRSLEGECLYRLGKFEAAHEAFQKAGSSMGSCCLLLSIQNHEMEHSQALILDLVHRQPSAYSWMAFADGWIDKIEEESDEQEQTTAKAIAVAAAEEALKWDRRAGNAWAVLAKYDGPEQKRAFCLERATLSGFIDTHKLSSKSFIQTKTCTFKARPLRRCRCELCSTLKV